MNDKIIIEGARENNLKNISLTIPKNKFIVLTGPSGSGKTSLAMDILHRECQRQYMESIGMTIDFISKPKVDFMIGLSPSIIVGQHVTNRNPRSTVGTVTDMYTYLRVIYEKLGERKCFNCQTTTLPSLENPAPDEESSGYKQYIYCPNCHQRLEKLTLSDFSFNTPDGACPTCDGLGKVDDIRIEYVFNEDFSLSEGCVNIWNGAYGEYQKSIFKAACDYYGIPIDENLPLKHFTDQQRALLFYGVESKEFTSYFPDKQPPKTVRAGKFEGVLTGMRRRYNEKGGNSGEAHLFYSQQCPDFQGKRLKKESREVLVAGTPITDVSNYSLEELLSWLTELQRSLTPENKTMVETFLHDLIVKVRRVINVGLGYLSLDRQTITLSGGEAQRLRLASIIGSALTGVLYILDEPTTGLHPKDTKELVEVMKQLRDLGNTVLVIEHDVNVMQEADYIIDMGPGAGNLGGTVVGEGSLRELMEQKHSVTGAFLRNRSIPTINRRKGTGKYLTIHNANKHNLKNITVSFPLGCLISVTGVSGSGKSTLVFDVLSTGKSGVYDGCEKITGFEDVDKVITVGQSPLSRMKRSNIATYTEVFTFIRNLYASLPESKKHNFDAKDFSFNTPGGRCENCQGMGFVSLDMHFLPEFEVECPVCHGKRFEEKILKVKYKGYSISDLLDLSIEESLPIFEDHKKIAPMIQLLCEIGLGYLKWGQSLTTLSGGEGQRLKLAKELKNQTNNHTLYLLDEPSTGLHPTDVNKLLVLLNRLVDAGNTVIVVEHNSDIIRASDWVIDLGPEGGSAGGMIVAEGTPEEIANMNSSYTGEYLKLN
ncbi:excinuclease ABC subunit UvrA [Thermaerobacillus caldiproteolyticus]|uniref:UvrABC system protein A n=1 Tax=Thermaerobacillus caldiproteolyticus TaxID=247480 RepID=A0A7V9Z8X1_9BACL|nr:excinuclease ABC subunit UvrA [Anoxybacillus caldiproteolyticus]MBA2876227.1 excinuclease ABC subunit A [Anoxybacillus caldiproteolyticus]